MPNYKYRARDKSGILFSGTIDSIGRDDVASHLDRMGYYPVSIQEERNGFKIHFHYCPVKVV